jgi:ABC-type Fe3+-hydroxamate transport system substrate-binding protein
MKPFVGASLPIVLSLLVLAGCGGSSSSESSTSTASATTAGGQNTRLSQAQWNEFKTVQDKARTVNTAAIATFSRCRSIVVSAKDSSKVEACIGKSTSAVVTTGKQTLSELDKLTANTSGACAKASEDLTGYVKLYVASVQALDTSMTQNTVPSTTSIDQATTALKDARASNVAFQAACKPAGAS